MPDDPRGTHAVIHALNQWMHEHWTFNYEGRIFPTPVITLPIVAEAIKELEWVVERGAKIILIRPAPVPGYEGYRSFALPEFDPFWEKVVEADITVGLHASDDGLTRYYNQWEGTQREHLPFAGPSAFTDIAHTQSRGIFDTVASLIGHGLLSRFPKLRVLPVENGSAWVRPMINALEISYGHNPKLFAEDPIMVLKRNIWVHPFHEDDPRRPHRPDRRRPGGLRVRLPAHRGYGGAAHLRRRARRPPARGHRPGDGGQPRGGDEATVCRLSGRARIAAPGGKQMQLTGPVTGGSHGWAFAAPVVDLAALGYRHDEFFLEGTATRYGPSPGCEQSWDGRWQVEPRRNGAVQDTHRRGAPRGPCRRFNGTVVVLWNNVSAGYENFGGGDSPELFEGGYAYAAVTAQRVGVHGAPVDPQGLLAWDPERYGSLSIPSDDYSFDIFTQAASVVGPDRADDGVDPMGGLDVRRLIAEGASQSAARLATYLNAIQPTTGGSTPSCSPCTSAAEHRSRSATPS